MRHPVGQVRPVARDRRERAGERVFEPVQQVSALGQPLDEGRIRQRRHLHPNAGAAGEVVGLQLRNLQIGRRTVEAGANDLADGGSEPVKTATPPANSRLNAPATEPRRMTASAMSADSDASAPSMRRASARSANMVAPSSSTNAEARSLNAREAGSQISRAGSGGSRSGGSGVRVRWTGWIPRRWSL